MAKKKAVTKKKRKPIESPTLRRAERAAKARKKSERRGRLNSIYKRAREGLPGLVRSRSGFWAPTEGTWYIRPFTFMVDGVEHLQVPYNRHFGINPEVRGTNIQCIGPGCPICELKDELSDDDWKKVSVSPRYLCNVVVRKNTEDKPPISEDSQKIARLPVRVARDIQDALGEPENEGCLDHRHGLDFKIRRTGTGMFDTKYKPTMPARTESPIGVDVEPVNLFRFSEAPPIDELEAVAETLLKLYG